MMGCCDHAEPKNNKKSYCNKNNNGNYENSNNIHVFLISTDMPQYVIVVTDNNRAFHFALIQVEG